MTPSALLLSTKRRKTLVVLGIPKALASRVEIRDQIPVLVGVFLKEGFIAFPVIRPWSFVFAGITMAGLEVGIGRV